MRRYLSKLRQVEVFPAMATGLLADLGATPAKVAQSLTERQIRGHADDRANNPLARYLATATGADAANVNYVSAHVLFTSPELVVEDIAVPPAAAEFLAQFDSGLHEHLVDRLAPRPLATRYLRSVAHDLAGVETLTRGTVQEAVHRYGTSDPLPDDLVAAIAAVGLEATDCATDTICELRFYCGELCVAMVRGCDDRYYRLGSEVLVSEALWLACAAYQHCSAGCGSHRQFPDRDEAVRHVLTHLGDTCRMHIDADGEVS